ncbi:MAG: hypothetical protein JSW63_06270, partial [Ignavibacterium sp.]
MKNSNEHLLKLSFSIALLSIAIISYQLSLIQILSIVQWYHFAYMVISIALLGFGAAGTFIAIFRNRLLNKIDSLLPLFMIVSGFLMAVVVTASQIPFIQFDSHHLFSEYSNIWRLLVTYLLFFLPFFFGALAIGLVFVRYVDVIGKLYFANMFGSGLGGLLVIVIMWIFQPAELPSVIALLPVVSGLIIISKKHRSLNFVLSAAALVFVFISYLLSPALKLSEYKSLSKALNLPDTEITESKSSPYGLIDIVSSKHIRYAPGLSINYPGIVTINNAAFKNGNWLGPLKFQRLDTSDYFSYSTTALPYVMKERKKVLILGADTGNQVEQAIYFKANEITAVEPDRALTDLLSGTFAMSSFSTYNQKEVSLSGITPRTHLMQSESTYDLIVLPIIGSFGGSSGLFALQEQYILTKEAFYIMWQRLNDNGIISIITYIDYPYRKPIKLLATIAEVLKDEGIHKPANYIGAIKNWNTISIVVKKSKISSIEAKRVREFCIKMNFDPVILPDINAEEQRRFNKLQDDSFYDYIDQILSSQKEREKLYSPNAFNIKPATDNQPYFSQFLQWKSIPQMIELFGADAVPFFEIGYLLLYITLVQTVLLAIILIILPLFKLGWGGASKTWALIYFSGLGLGYMFIEIIFIQR